MDVGVYIIYEERHDLKSFDESFSGYSLWVILIFFLLVCIFYFFCKDHVLLIH